MMSFFFIESMTYSVCLNRFGKKTLKYLILVSLREYQSKIQYFLFTLALSLVLNNLYLDQ